MFLAVLGPEIHLLYSFVYTRTVCVQECSKSGKITIYRVAAKTSSGDILLRQAVLGTNKNLMEDVGC